MGVEVSHDDVITKGVEVSHDDVITKRIEVSHDDVITKGVEKMVKISRETGRTAGDRGYVNVMKVDGDIIDDGIIIITLLGRGVRWWSHRGKASSQIS